MADHEFTVTISGAKGKGAPVPAVIAKLRALEALFEASASALLRPGASRISIPDALRDFATLQIKDAQPTNSLAVVLLEPEAESNYDGEYAVEIPKTRYSFRKALIAAATENSADIVQLFPEKADQVRVLTALRNLAPAPDEAPVVIDNIDPLGKSFIFRDQQRRWAEDSMPSLAPEPGTFSGMIKTGMLGGSPKFKLFDGDRHIRLRPDQKGVSLLTPMFGQVVEVTGVVEFKPDGAIKEINQITDISPFMYRTSKIRAGSRIFELTEEIEYACTASANARGFTLTQDALGTIAYARSLKASISAAQDDFAALWDEIAAVPEDDLHASAINLRGLLRRLVKDIKQIEGQE